MKWIKDPIDSTLVKDISKKYGLSLFESSVLVRRGITRGEDILFFLEQDFIYLHQPFMFRDMEIAIDRINDAQSDQETVLVYGDKDVDGMTSTVIAVTALRKRDIETIWQVPIGDLGYGLSKEDIDWAKEQGVTLIITVDCGISNIEECEYAHSLGIDMLIFDHHTPGAILPPALAVIDAKISSQQYPFDGLCAGALAQKLYLALEISSIEIYNSDIVLLNIVPINGGNKFEMMCIRNLVVQWRKSLTVSNDNGHYQREEFVELLGGSQLIIFDEKTQKRLLQESFGTIDLYAFDAQTLVNKYFGKLQNKSLLQIIDTVRLVRYLDTKLEEIDILFQLYKSIVYVKYPQLKEAFYEISDLAAIATIADMMPLVNENRIIYKIGTEKLQQNPNKNLACLLELLKIEHATISSNTIGWQIAPVLNSAGRMGQANIAIEMLLADEEKEAFEKAEILVDLNKARKKQMNTLKAQIKESVEKSFEARKNFILVYNDELPHSFTGMVAGTYSRQYGVPVIIIAQRGNDIISGSIRCPSSFNATELIRTLEPYIIDGGGHKAAAGFSVSVKNKEIFTEELLMYLEKKTASTISYNDTIGIDLEIPEKYFNLNEVKKLTTTLEPYGQTWNTIHILLPHIKIQSCETLGADNAHIKFILTLGKYQVPAFYGNIKH